MSECPGITGAEYDVLADKRTHHLHCPGCAPQGDQERDTLRAQIEQLRAERDAERTARELSWSLEIDQLQRLVMQQREALRSVIAIIDSEAYLGLALFAYSHNYKCCSDEETERNIATLDKARAVLAQDRVLSACRGHSETGPA